MECVSWTDMLPRRKWIGGREHTRVDNTRSGKSAKSLSERQRGTIFPVLSADMDQSTQLIVFFLSLVIGCHIPVFLLHLASPFSLHLSPCVVAFSSLSSLFSFLKRTQNKKTDIGGHRSHGDEQAYDGELYLRWLQWGAHAPILRTHPQVRARYHRWP